MNKNLTDLEMLIINLFGVISFREQEILRLRFLENMTEQSVGEFYHLTKERIRQLENRALKEIDKTLFGITKIN